MNTAFMTSPIGDLTIDSTGLRKAVDEITRLRKIIEDEMDKFTKLRILRYDSDEIKEIAIKTVSVIKTCNGAEYLYYETFCDEAGYGIKVDMTTVKAWDVQGTIPCGGGTLLNL